MRITRLRTRTRRGRLEVALRVSKRSSVTVTVRAGDGVVARATRALLRGPERFAFPRPRGRGRVSVEVRATSLTGIVSTAEAR